GLLAEIDIQPLSFERQVVREQVLAASARRPSDVIGVAGGAPHGVAFMSTIAQARPPVPYRSNCGVARKPSRPRTVPNNSRLVSTSQTVLSVAVVKLPDASISDHETSASRPHTREPDWRLKP